MLDYTSINVKKIKQTFTQDDYGNARRNLAPAIASMCRNALAACSIVSVGKPNCSKLTFHSRTTCHTLPMIWSA
jgi:hypothetical protein